MSYCRWSDDDYACDVYVYQSASNGGYVTHVAGSRYVFASPLPDRVPFDKEHMSEWFSRHQVVSDMIENSKMVRIGLPHDGEDFQDMYPEDCADRLELLKALGYNVPQYAIDELRSEATDNGRD